MEVKHEYAPVGHDCTCKCHDGAELFEYLPCCKYQGLPHSRPTLTPELLALVRKMAPQRIAEDLLSVQPMPGDLMKRAMAEAKDEAWLRANGYKPVSHHGLMWIKEDDNEQTRKED